MTTYPPQQLSLSILNQQIPLSVGTKIYTNEISVLRSQSSDGVVAEVTANPKNPSILGLQNRSYQAWTVILPNGTQQQVLPSQNVKLNPGTRINFVSVKGEICASQPSWQPSYPTTYTKEENEPLPQPLPPDNGNGAIEPPRHIQPIPDPVLLNEDYQAKLKKAQDRINSAVGAGILSSIITLGFVIFTEQTEFLIDFFIASSLTFGIYKKSRTCAIIMLIYFISGKIIMMAQSGGSNSSIGWLSIVFIIWYWLGIQGTFAYHNLKKQVRS